MSTSLKKRLGRLRSKVRRGWKGNRGDRAQSTLAAYDSWAEDYDSDTAANMAILLEGDRLAELMAPQPDQLVLDAGCGTGRHVALLKDHCTVVGIDFSEPMLAVAARKHPDVEFMRADLTQTLPFEDHTFDMVLSSLVLSHIKDIAVPLAEFARVTKEDGRIFVIDFVRHPTLDWDDLEYQDQPVYPLDFIATSRTHTIEKYLDLSSRVGLSLDRIIPLRLGEKAASILSPQSYERYRGTWGSVVYIFEPAAS